MLKYALGGIVLSTSMHSAAFSLGGYSGQAIIGRPLDMQVRSSTPLADIELAGCLLAEVSYGDTRLPASSVSLGVSATQDGAVIRVRTTRPVDEPVVSVTLQGGCAADRFSRKYTLLADIDPSVLAAAPAGLPLVVAPPLGASAAPSAPSASLPSTAPVAPPAVVGQGAALPPVPSPAPTPAPAPAPRAAAAPAPVPAAAPRPQPRVQPRAQAPRPAPAPAPAPRPPAQRPVPAPAPAVTAAPAPAPKPPAPVAAAPAAPAAPAGPRLKLDPIDLSPGRNPGLKLNTELGSQPAATAQQREASADLWAALNTPPEQVADNARRVAAMENDLKALREQQAALQASVAALTAQLQAERDERAPKSLLYALGAALLLAAAALAWLLAERRKLRGTPAPGDAPWWQPSELASAPAGGAPPVAAPATAAAAAAVAPASAPVVVPSPNEALAALEVSEATESSFVQPLDASPVSVEDLMDLHQQHAFYVSLRQETEAQALLEHFIAEHPGACELPYLWWLQQAGDNSAQRERAASRYQADFGLPAPNAALLDPTAYGLDSQGKFIEVLTRFWPKPESLDLLRNTLLAPPQTGLLERHSLAAYDDALMLYGVVHTLLNDTDLRPPVARAAAPAPAPRPVEPANWAVPAAVVAAAPATATTSPSPSASALATVSAPTPAEAPRPDPNAPLDLDLGFIADHKPPEPAPAAEADSATRDLPMLDFDLFADDPKAPPASGPGQG